MASEKKKLLEEKNIHLWFNGSPLAFCSMKLVLDMNVGAIFAYAKFMNIQPEPLKTVVCDIICYDSVRRQIDIISDCVYNKLDIQRNKSFGTEIGFRINHPQTRNVEFMLKSVTTMSGQTWNNTEKRRFNIDLQQESIFNVQGDLHRQFIEDCARANADQAKLIFQPVFDTDHWMCSCGSFNWTDEDVCCSCGVGREWIRRNTQKEVLEHQAADREAAARRVRNEAEAKDAKGREKQSEEFKKRRESYRKEQKKRDLKNQSNKIFAALLVIALVCVGGYCFYQYGMPYVRYISAVTDMNNSNYDNAIAQFQKMSGYLDSDELMKKSIYGKATRIYNSGNLVEAAELYKSIDGYSDSGEKYQEAIRSAAENAEKEGDVFKAADLYSRLGNYALDEFDSCRKKIYDDADKLLDRKKYDEAYESFIYLGDFKESADKANECMYHMAKQSYENMDYITAIDRYESIKGYKDTDVIVEGLADLKCLLSAAVADGTPAAWNGYNIECPKCGQRVDYVFEFYGNGEFKFGIMCDNESENQIMTGSYKVENGKIYQRVVKNGNSKWEVMSDILNISPSITGPEGKNTAIVLTSPFDHKEITLYGNIITDDTISII